MTPPSAVKAPAVFVDRVEADREVTEAVTEIIVQVRNGGGPLGV